MKSTIERVLENLLDIIIALSCTWLIAEMTGGDIDFVILFLLLVLLLRRKP